MPLFDGWGNVGNLGTISQYGPFVILLAATITTFNLNVCTEGPGLGHSGGVLSLEDWSKFFNLRQLLCRQAAIYNPSEAASLPETLGHLELSLTALLGLQESEPFVLQYSHFHED
jgi:hypothetical protein